MLLQPRAEDGAERRLTVDARTTYACPNVLTRYRFVRMHTNTPTSMRAPGHVTGVFALECAMDEPAARLGMDPVELRILNHADRNHARSAGRHPPADGDYEVVSRSPVARGCKTSIA